MPKALGHAAIRTGYDVLFTTQSKMLNQLQAARATHGYDRHFAKLAAVENSYLANLKKVCPFIEEGKKTPALNQLNAFIHKVQTDISKGNIGSAAGTNLIQMANELIAKLQG